jgi:hypothetical protein
MATSTTSPSSGPGVGGQALLKRRAGSSLQEFRNHYINRHAPIAIPWCLANGVTYYAQVRLSKQSHTTATSPQHIPPKLNLPDPPPAPLVYARD